MRFTQLSLRSKLTTVILLLTSAAFAEIPPSSIQLAITPAGPVTAGTAVTLTATVTPGAPMPITAGLVTFCDANAAHCLDSAIVGTAQVTAASTASFKFVPGVGTHSYTAVLQSTVNFLGSTSAPVSLTVNGNSSYLSLTSLNASGSANPYSLTAFVAAFGTQPLGQTTVSFLDTSNANAVLATAALDPTSLQFGFLSGSGSPDPLGTFPNQIVLGDFNNDGKLDMAVTNSGFNLATSSLSILLGKGDGRFQTQLTNPTGTDPFGLATGDFNHDGKTDIVVANQTDNTVGVFLGSGDGTFQPQVTYAVGLSPISVAVADFNLDGIEDIAVLDRGDSNVVLLLGQGDGTFVLQQTCVCGCTTDTFPVGSNAFQLVSADFNGDGIPDLAVSNTGDATVSVLLGTVGGFASQVTYAVGNAPQGIATADLDGNGNVDLVVANSNDATIGALLGNGNGTFQSQVTYPSGNAPLGIATADVDRNGNTDVIVSNSNDNTITIYRGNGETLLPDPNVYGTGNIPFGIAAGDLNGDGVPDLAVVDNGGEVSQPSDVTIWLSARGETATASSVSVGPGTHNVLASYPGDASRAAATSGSTVALQGPPLTATATTLVAAPNPASSGQTVTLTATVAPAPTGSALGMVSFYDGATLLGTGTVNSSGVATLTVSTLTTGTRSLTAVYSGNTLFAGSTSTAVSETVNPIYTVTGPVTPVKVKAGGAAVFNLNVPPVGGAFNSVVTLSVSGLPPGATATFNPPSVTPGANGAPTVMTVQTAAQAAGLPAPSNPAFPNPAFPFASTVLAAGFCLVAGTRKRLGKALPVLVAGLVLTGGTLMLTGCNGGFAGAQSQSYVLTVTGTSGSLHASTTVTLVVQ